MIWEVFDVEIASLLRSLVPKSVSRLLIFSFGLLHCVPNVEFLVLSDVSSRKVLDGLQSTFRTVLFVEALRVFVADEAKLTDVVLHKDQRLDVSESFKHFSHLLVSEVERDVLHINVVDEPSELPSISWLELEGHSLALILAELDCFGSCSLFLETYEAVSS